jgi:hypothetical protein
VEIDPERGQGPTWTVHPVVREMGPEWSRHSEG